MIKAQWTVYKVVLKRDGNHRYLEERKSSYLVTLLLFTPDHTWFRAVFMKIASTDVLFVVEAKRSIELYKAGRQTLVIKKYSEQCQFG